MEISKLTSTSSRRTRSISLSEGITNKAFSGEPFGTDQVTQLGANHYMFQRRGTKIFVKEYPTANQERDSNELSEENDDVFLPEGAEVSEKEEKYSSFAGWMSGLYAVILVVLALVLKVSQFLAEEITSIEIYWFLIVIYGVGTIWLVLYQPLATSCYKHKEKMSFAKTNKVNNRWLKGVLALFGLAIIIKDGLEFLAFLHMDGNLCKEKTLYAILPISNALFLITQVNYLFSHSKVFTQDFKILTKFGVMHVVSTNLSIWIATIVDETVAALMLNTEEGHHEDTNGSTTLSPYYADPESALRITIDDNDMLKLLWSWQEQNVRKSLYSTTIVQTRSTNHHFNIIFSGNCTCDSNFCSSIAAAEAFLFPFVVEFSLVASCLLYITWRNIGKTPPLCQHIIKPSYKLYRSYKGVLAGGVMLFATILVIVFLGTSHSDYPAEERDYFTEIDTLTIYNSFLIVFQTLMIGGCFGGFFLYARLPHEYEQDSEQLDAVLLIICLVGPILSGLFSVLAVGLGKANRETPWLLSLGVSISDILQTIIQVIFILDGLNHKPIIHEEDNDTKNKIEKSAGRPLVLSSLSVNPNNEEFNSSKTLEASGSLDRSQAPSYDRRASNFSSLQKPNKVQTRPNQLEQVVEEQKSDSDDEISAVETDGKEALQKTQATSFNNNIKNLQDLENNNDSRPKPVLAVVPSQRGEVYEQVNRNKVEVVDETRSEKYPRPASSLASPFGSEYGNSEDRIITTLSNQPNIKIVAETRVSPPDKRRLVLRNTLMFLLISNACLWVFSSLEGTAFVIYQFQEVYYGAHAWTIITMLTRPLSIFFRMHSAACLFEIWSFA